MSSDEEPVYGKSRERRRRPRRPKLEDPIALDAARARTTHEKADELRRAMSVGPGGQKRALAKLFGRRVKAFKKVLRRAMRRGR